ncbi:MAG: sulfatase-like hydrolase/transferase, partial [Planctomycetota bacterium]
MIFITTDIMAKGKSNHFGRRVIFGIIVMLTGELLQIAPLQAQELVRPNFVFFLVDDLRFDGTSASGHPFASTPNIDRIADEGLRFNYAYVTTSLCTPSRISFLTGLYAQTHGVQSNDTPLDYASHVTFPMLLQGAAYDTAFIGKSHMGTYGRPVPGFDYWASWSGQGVYFATSQQPLIMKISTDGSTYTSVVYDNGEYNTDLITDYAEDWLNSRPHDPGSGELVSPFCLCLWYKAVHEPREPATRHANLYPDGDFDPLSEAVLNPSIYDKPYIVQNSISWWQNLTLGQKKGVINLFSRQDSRTLAAVDESVADIMTVLSNMGVLDNTVVIFTSDNGFFFKEFGLTDKRWQYEPSIRIPWFVRYPPMITAGRTSDLPILNIDLAPTFLDLAGVVMPAGLQGRSLRPIFEETAVPETWRISYLTEYFKESQYNVPTSDATTMFCYGVKYKYTYYPNKPEVAEFDELYDLTVDPDENSNVINQPLYATQLAAIIEERERLMDAYTSQLTAYIDLGVSNLESGLQLVAVADGDTEPADIGGRDARKNLDPDQDNYMYFAIHDNFAFQGNKPNVYIAIDYYDTDFGSLELQYDAAYGDIYKNGGSVMLTGTNTWRQCMFTITDAYFGNRQNNGADFRIFGGANAMFYLDVVGVSEESLLPDQADNPNPPDQTTDESIDSNLSWTPADKATSYDVYLGTINPPPFVVNQTETTFDPVTMDYLTQYYWRIDAVNGF